MIKKCVICGAEFEPIGRNAKRQIYCGKTCSRIANKERERDRRNYQKRYKYMDTDKPIPYSRKHAQDAHKRQSDIERKARAAGLSYGKYQMMLYMERMKEAKG